MIGGSSVGLEGELEPSDPPSADPWSSSSSWGNVTNDICFTKLQDSITSSIKVHKLIEKPKAYTVRVEIPNQFSIHMVQICVVDEWFRFWTS